MRIEKFKDEVVLLYLLLQRNFYASQMKASSVWSTALPLTTDYVIKVCAEIT